MISLNMRLQKKDLFSLFLETSFHYQPLFKSCPGGLKHSRDSAVFLLTCTLMCRVSTTRCFSVISAAAAFLSGILQRVWMSDTLLLNACFPLKEQVELKIKKIKREKEAEDHFCFSLWTRGQKRSSSGEKSSDLSIFYKVKFKANILTERASKYFKLYPIDLSKHI